MSAYDQPHWREWLREWGLLLVAILYAASVAVGHFERREERAELRARIRFANAEISRLEAVPPTRCDSPLLARRDGNVPDDLDTRDRVWKCSTVEAQKPAASPQ